MDTVLIVGDSPEFNYLMQRYVRRSGHRTVLVDADGEILALARREGPIVIILESDRSQKPAWKTIEALKTDQLTRDIPVVICSWLDEKSHSPESDDVIYLRKPVLYRDLASALMTCGVSIAADDLGDTQTCGQRNSAGGGGER